MNAQSLALIPPAPWFTLGICRSGSALENPQSTLSIWPERAFDDSISQQGARIRDAPHQRSRGRAACDDEQSDELSPTIWRHARREAAWRFRAVSRGGRGLETATQVASATFTPGGVSQLLPHFHEAGIHLLRSLDKQFAVNLARRFQDTALEAVLRALFSMPESSERAKLDALARAYVAGPGRPSLFDAFATREDSFAFTLRKRERFQAVWFGEIDAIVATRRARPRTAGQCDLLDLLMELKDAETGEGLSDVEIRDQCATMFFAGSETTARLDVLGLLSAGAEPGGTKPRTLGN